MAETKGLQPRLYQDAPPALQTKLDMNATLLVSWWCTLFSLTAIVIRLMGRWVRTERLFREDKIMFWSVIPLMIRMGLIHVVLIWGTNNTVTTGLSLEQIRQREIGSKLVLAARIFYAAFIWVAKLTVLEFLKRLIGRSWARSYEIGLRMIYGFLIATYIAVVISTLTECAPFSHYWQVVPDPGPKCREGLVQLVVMGVCDIITDVMLIVYPIPLVMSSTGMRMRKKLSLVLLFLLSLVLIAITAYRVPSTISRRSSQQYRSLLASLEILAATAVSNAVVIGSFIRDKGVKKAKFRLPSLDGSSTVTRTPARSRSMTLQYWGSDEDLVRGVGVSLPPSLRRGASADQIPRAAPVALPNHRRSEPAIPMNSRRRATIDSQWTFHSSRRRPRRNSDDSFSSSSTDIKLRDLKSHLEDPVSPTAMPETPGKLSFFDVGGLVDNPVSDTPSGTSRAASIQEQGRNQSQAHSTRSGSRAFLSDIGGLWIRHRDDGGSTSSHGYTSASPGRSPERRDTRQLSTRLPLQEEEDEDDDDDDARHSPVGPDSLSFTDVGGLLR